MAKIVSFYGTIDELTVRVGGPYPIRAYGTVASIDQTPEGGLNVRASDGEHATHYHSSWYDHSSVVTQ